MKNVMFRDTPIPKPQRSTFDLSYEDKTSGNIGEIMPILWYDVIPGDTFAIKSEVLCKFAPLLAPLLHRVDLYMHYFFTPYRLLMQPLGVTQAGWKEFITGDPDTEFTNDELPWVTINNANKAYFLENTLAGYLGLPVIDAGTTVTQDIDINVRPVGS